MSDELQNNQIDEDNQEDEHLYVHYSLKVDGGQSPERIDKYVFQRTAINSRNKIQNAAKAGCVLVNDKAVKSNYKIRPHDEIKIVMPKPMGSYELIPEEMPLNIVYEDEQLMIVNKPAGLVVHPGSGNYTGTLVHGLAHHFDNLPINERGIEGARRPGLVHRIDKDTTGLMVVAKTDFTMTHLARQFFDHTVVRRYHALVWGDLKEEEGTITGHVGRNIRYRKVMDVFPEGDRGKHAITHYKVLERFGYVTLVECRLETGRTHQIRVHFKSVRHPLFNDVSYGGDKIIKGTVYTKYRQFVDNAFKIIQRHALHAKILGFTHPTTGKEMYFESELPEDMEKAIEKWRK
ncbi:MAG: RluA family pseudouridine synthase, partial [Chitinophagales bacterium]